MIIARTVRRGAFLLGWALTAVGALGNQSLAQDAPLPQATPLEGQVVLDGRPVAGTSVSLHRVTSESSGAVASMVTDDSGRFVFSRDVEEGATFEFYFVTAQFNTVTFFGPFVRPDETPELYTVAVYDTTTVLAQPVRIVARHMVMVPDVTGAWEINEIVDILNPTSLALVPTAGAAAWDFGLPEGASDFDVGPADVLPHELAYMDGRVLHLTPIIPGSRELFVRYRLPADASPAGLVITEPTDSLHIYVRQPSHLTGVSGIQSQRMIEDGQDRYLQYTVLDVEPGSHIELRWARPGPPVDPVKTAVALTLGLLLVAAVIALKNRPPTPGRA